MKSNKVERSKEIRELSSFELIQVTGGSASLSFNSSQEVIERDVRTMKGDLIPHKPRIPPVGSLIAD